jgi:ABC-type transport system substrate-binding protein
LKTIRKWTLALIIVVLIVGIVVSTMYLTRRQVTPTFSLAPSTLVAAQGANITFSVYGLESNGVATIYFGDGQEANTTSTLTHAYQNAGRYLVGAEEFVNGQSVASTFQALQTIQVTPQVSESVAPFISIPTITFNVSRNPSAPIIQVGEWLYLYAGFLEPPSGLNSLKGWCMSIWSGSGCGQADYNWVFGKGTFAPVKMLAEDANVTSLKPMSNNPMRMVYGQSGLFPVTLTLVFLYPENSSLPGACLRLGNSSVGQCWTSVEQTIAVSSPSQPYALFLYAGIVPNPSVINVVKNIGGGPVSFDPQIDYEVTGLEVMANIHSTLLIYNGSSTTQFIPMVAAQLPSVTNGGISADYMTYTFQIRAGLKFSNGDPLTAYDIWYSMVRAMLFVGGNMGTPDWILAQYLDGYALLGAANDTTDFNAIMDALTYSNSSNTVIFKLAKPTVPQLIFTAVADSAGAGILDASWLSQVGAGITFTPAGFYAYQNQSNYGSLNLKVQWDPVASGPYMIQSCVLGQSVTLVPNPGFPGLPGIPVVNNTVVIQWVKDPETAYDLFTSGQADIVAYLPASYLALVSKMVADGKADMYQAPTLTTTYSGFFFDINATKLKSDFGPQYHVPSDYFLDLDVREAFAYAFNYTYYLDEIKGNKKYGIDFGNGYAGVVIPGMPYYVPPDQFQNVPTYDLAKAKQLLQQSGQYGTSVNIPACMVEGDTESFAAVQMWAAALNSIDPNIVMTPVYITPPEFYAYTAVLSQNPIPITFTNWIADYPYPSDVVDTMYLWPGAVKYLNTTGHPDEAAMYARMNSLIQIADSTTNATLAAQDYKAAEQLGINLYLYVYLCIDSSFLVVKPYMLGYQGQISYQENPIYYTDGLYFWWVKTCGSIQACSGRGIGP